MRRGKPESNEIADYNEVDVNGATVYVHNALAGYERLEIAPDLNYGGKLAVKGFSEESKGCY